MMRALRRGEAVGLLPDQVPPQGMGVWADFFGAPAYTMTLAARLAQQSGAPIVLAWCERLPDGRGFHLRLSRLAEPLPAQGEDAQALQLAQAEVINRAMEQLIQQCPQQYLWGYNRYKRPRNVRCGGPGARRLMKTWPAHALLALLWLLHWLPLGCRRRWAARSAACSTPWRASGGASRRATCSCACPS